MIDKREPLRRFVGAGLSDLIGFLSSLEDPIIIGRRYSKELLIKAFAAWCVARKVSVNDADGEAWLAACKSGVMKGEVDDSAE